MKNLLNMISRLSEVIENVILRLIVSNRLISEQPSLIMFYALLVRIFRLFIVSTICAYLEFIIDMCSLAYSAASAYSLITFFIS
jgi:hypothetical protein